MDKKVKFILISASVLGTLLGTSAGLFAINAAWQHNPQGEFSSDPYLLIPIFLVWFVHNSSLFYLYAFGTYIFRNKKIFFHLITLMFSIFTIGIFISLYITNSELYFLSGNILVPLNVIVILLVFMFSVYRSFRTKSTESD
jgi:hypothetical protein